MALPAYKVGQVLFVIPKDKPQLIPIQIIEEITKKSLSGEMISYMVRINKEGKVVDINSINGELFESATTAQRTLIERSTQAIGAMVNRAVKLASEWYPGAFEDSIGLTKDEVVIHQLLPDPEEDNIITLEDGTRARIKKLPDSLK